MALKKCSPEIFARIWADHRTSGLLKSKDRAPQKVSLPPFPGRSIPNGKVRRPRSHQPYGWPSRFSLAFLPPISLPAIDKSSRPSPQEAPGPFPVYCPGQLGFHCGWETRQNTRRGFGRASRGSERTSNAKPGHPRWRVKRALSLPFLRRLPRLSSVTSTSLSETSLLLPTSRIPPLPTRDLCATILHPQLVAMPAGLVTATSLVSGRILPASDT
jgi:hypothetical protein